MGEEKWAKTWLIIKKWLRRFTFDTALDYKEFLNDQEFMVHVFDTYKNCRTFLKGIHINLDSWFPHRDSEIWKQDPGYGL